jgi:hypothetical protein
MRTEGIQKENVVTSKSRLSGGKPMFGYGMPNCTLEIAGKVLEAAGIWPHDLVDLKALSKLGKTDSEEIEGALSEEQIDEEIL